MNLKSLFICGIAVLVFSCSKNETTPTVVPPTPTNTTTKDSNIVLPITFEDTNIIYKTVSFSSASSGNDATTTASIVDNPSKTGLNTTGKVLKIAEPATGSSTWGGAHITLKDPIDFATKKRNQNKNL